MSDYNIVLGKITRFTLNIDAIVEILLEGRDAKFFVINLRSIVDGKFQSGLLEGLSLCMWEGDQVFGTMAVSTYQLRAYLKIILVSNNYQSGKSGLQTIITWVQYITGTLFHL